MAIVSTDLIVYAAANKPTDDTSTNGGAIDENERVFFTQLAADDSIEVVSSNAGDTTQQITVTARDATGAIVSETVALNGTTPVVLSTMGDVERVLRALLDGDAAGNVTVRRDGAAGDIAVIPAGERGFRRMFTNAFADPSSGKDYYEKFFFKNAHGTLSLLTATVTQSADATGKVTFALAAAVDDSATTTNRLTAPAGTFDDAAKVVPGTDLAAGSAIGVWLKLALDAGETPIKSTFTPQLAGSSV